MKKLIASLCAAAAFAAVADTVTSDTVFGVLKVSSTKTQTLISAPWVAAGSTDSSVSPVKVTDLVKTSNLTANDDMDKADQLMLYRNSAYTVWYLKSVDGVKTWTTPTQVGSGQTAGTTETIARGDALLVVRRDPTNDGGIYLYGQYCKDPIGSKDLPANAYTLISPANTTSDALDLNDSTKIAFTGVNTDDKIRLQWSNGVAFTLTWDETNKKWVHPLRGDSYAKVQPGQGFWYINTGSAASVELK